MQVHLETRSLLLRAPDPFVIRDALPTGSRILPDGSMAVKHTTETTRVLRNLGFDAPSPIATYYDWPGRHRPFEHQITMADFHTMHRRAFNLSEQGTMKTAANLWAADWLMKTGAVRKALVLAPLSTLRRVWEDEIRSVLLHRKLAIVHGDKTKREKALRADVEFYILNHDGIVLSAVRDLLEEREDIDLVIVDEGSKGFRNASTDRYKALVKYLKPEMRVWWLTGTPCPNSPADVWSQCRIISPERVPPYYGRFRRLTMNEVDPDHHIWRPRKDGFAVAYTAMQPAIRFEKKDCIDLPPVVLEPRTADLSPEQRRAFKTMKNDMFMEDQRASANGDLITAVNAADRINKLRQILCGGVRRKDTGEYVILDHKPRLKVLLECMECASAKGIVIVPFKGILHALQAEVNKAGYTTGLINGDVGISARDKIISDFKEKDDPRWLLCHPAVMAHGLNLTEADTLVFYAPIFSNDDYQQVIERFNRAGQTRKMTIVRIGAHALEWRIYGMVDDRNESQTSVLKLYQITMRET